MSSYHTKQTGRLRPPIDVEHTQTHYGRMHRKTEQTTEHEVF